MIEHKIIEHLKSVNSHLFEIEEKCKSDPKNIELQKLYQRMLIEYRELLDVIKTSLNSEKKITKKELDLIDLEYTQFRISE
jgi:hypothetical protein